MMTANPATTYLKAETSSKFTTTGSAFHHTGNVNELLKTYRQFMDLSLNKSNRLRKSIYLQNLNKKMMEKQKQLIERQKQMQEMQRRKAIERRMLTRGSSMASAGYESVVNIELPG